MQTRFSDDLNSYIDDNSEDDWPMIVRLRLDVGSDFLISEHKMDIEL